VVLRFTVAQHSHGQSSIHGQAGGETARLGSQFQEVARTLNAHFLDKQEIIRLLIISAIAGEHLVLIGPPGTAKSAIIRMFARLLDARYFEYLLTRFTEPNELFGRSTSRSSARAATSGGPRTCSRAPRSCSWTRSSSPTRRS